jgi:hypothetical protein
MKMEQHKVECPQCGVPAEPVNDCREPTARGGCGHLLKYQGHQWVVVPDEYELRQENTRLREERDQLKALLQEMWDRNGAALDLELRVMRALGEEGAD